MALLAVASPALAWSGNPSATVVTRALRNGNVNYYTADFNDGLDSTNAETPLEVDGHFVQCWDVVNQYVVRPVIQDTFARWNACQTHYLIPEARVLMSDTLGAGEQDELQPFMALLMSCLLAALMSRAL